MESEINSMWEEASYRPVSAESLAFVSSLMDDCPSSAVESSVNDSSRLDSSRFLSSCRIVPPPPVGVMFHNSRDVFNKDFSSNLSGIHSIESSRLSFLDLSCRLRPESAVELAVGLRGGVDERTDTLLRLGGVHQVLEHAATTISNRGSSSKNNNRKATATSFNQPTKTGNCSNSISSGTNSNQNGYNSSSSSSSSSSNNSGSNYNSSNSSNNNSSNNSSNGFGDSANYHNGDNRLNKFEDDTGDLLADSYKRDLKGLYSDWIDRIKYKDWSIYRDTDSESNLLNSTSNSISKSTSQYQTTTAASEDAYMNQMDTNKTDDSCTDCMYDSIHNSTSSTSSRVINSVIDPTSSDFIVPIYSLGKRRRFYVDVLNELKFLDDEKLTKMNNNNISNNNNSSNNNNNNNSNGGGNISVVTDWNEVLNNYVDGHDGVYRDWLSRSITEYLYYRDSPSLSYVVSGSEINSQQDSLSTTVSSENKLTVKTADSGGRDVGMRMSRAKAKSSKTNWLDSYRTGEVLVHAPPVPVTIQHPASWGPRSRISPELLNDNDSSSNNNNSSSSSSSSSSSNNNTSNSNSKSHSKGRSNSKDRSNSNSNNDNNSNNSNNKISIGDSNDKGVARFKGLIGGKHLFQHIHPASVSSTIVQPPGFYSNPVNRISISDCRKSAVSDAAAGPILDEIVDDREVEDVDDFNCYILRLEKSLLLTENEKFKRLSALKRYAQMDALGNSLKTKRQLLSTRLNSFYLASEPGKSNKFMYPIIPVPFPLSHSPSPSSLSAMASSSSSNGVQFENKPEMASESAIASEAGIVAEALVISESEMVPENITIPEPIKAIPAESTTVVSESNGTDSSSNLQQNQALSATAAAATTTTTTITTTTEISNRRKIKSRYADYGLNNNNPKRLLNAKQSVHKATARHTMVGACLLEHVKFGRFILNLKVGDVIECYIENQWLLAEIAKLKFDSNLLRFVKVKPYLSTPLEMWWIAVEDARIAPMGTNIKRDFLNVFNMGVRTDSELDFYDDSNNDIANAMDDGQGEGGEEEMGNPSDYDLSAFGPTHLREDILDNVISNSSNNNNNDDGNNNNNNTTTTAAATTTTTTTTTNSSDKSNSDSNYTNRNNSNKQECVSNSSDNNMDSIDTFEQCSQDNSVITFEQYNAHSSDSLTMGSGIGNNSEVLA